MGIVGGFIINFNRHYFLVLFYFLVFVATGCRHSCWTLSEILCWVNAAMHGLKGSVQSLGAGWVECGEGEAEATVVSD